jgi:hypothetical protein
MPTRNGSKKMKPQPTIWTNVGRAFLTTLALMVVETILLILIMSLVQWICYGTKSYIEGVNPFVSILSNAAFVFLMRFVLGFSLLNTALWLFLDLEAKTISLKLACFANALTILVMYVVWDHNFDILKELFRLKDWDDLFDPFKTAVYCALLSPLIVKPVNFLPTSFAVILKKAESNQVG